MFLHQIMNEMKKKCLILKKNTTTPSTGKKFIFIMVKYQLRSYTIKDMAM